VRAGDVPRTEYRIPPFCLATRGPRYRNLLLTVTDGNGAVFRALGGALALTDQQSRLQSTAAEPERFDQPRPARRAARLWSVRFVRFSVVAASSTLLQLLVLFGLTRLGVDKVLANGIGFALSAQLNFVLSARLTWRDRGPRYAAHARSPGRARLRAWSARWASFNVVALIALAVNELVFWVATHTGVRLLVASLLGIACGALVTFTANNLVTFRRAAPRAGEVDAEHRPALDEIRARTREEGVAFFLPAFNEAANLRAIVPRAVDYFHRLACPFTVTIVDDGSTRDDTFETAEQLAHAYPGHVQALHHPRNLGYGAALQSGMRAGLETGHGLIAFCDADGQFDIESFGTLVAALQDGEADLSAGYRIARADSLARRLMGRAWHRLARVVLGFTAARDVDCGFKVFTRAMLSDIEPRISGDYAAVSPEILARAVSADYTVTEAGITHRPRAHGHQTGARPRVVLLSLARLFRLRLALRKERSGSTAAWMPQRKPRQAKRDLVAWAVGFTATALSVIAYAVTDRLHGVLLYVDSISHLEIARRVVSSTSPGLAQLGYVWLPLPHLLMVPLIWITPLYRNGFAGSAVSMAAYVAATVLIYKITFRLSGQKLAGVVAAAVFALNVNMLYMQSTPMTEALLFCMLAGMVYCVQQWADTDRYQYLMAGGVTAVAATLTRYESWPVLACLVLAVAFIAWHRKRHGLARKLRLGGALDRFVAFGVVAFAGILAWVIWNWAIFGNPLDFQDGTYAKPSNWVSKGEPAIGNWLVAAKTYWFAMLDNETWPLLLLAAAGLACLIVREWRTIHGAARSLPVLSLLVLLPFFVVSLYSGQRPLHVLQIESDLYNVRFGLIMLVPTAIGVGYLAGMLRRVRPAMYVAGALAVVLAAGLGANLLRKDNVVTYIAASETLTSAPVLAQDPVVAFLKGHYTGGLVLMQSFGNESIAFGVPSDELVYEGSYRQWLPSLRDPSANHIEWIIARCGHDPSPDKVCLALDGPKLSHYQAVYISPGSDYRVYRLKG
jgi:glycosyltransferase involved in cell wall biosynthesis/putative flippase GtrA